MTTKSKPQLADEVFGACKALNAAIEEARKSGLAVQSWAFWDDQVDVFVSEKPTKPKDYLPSVP